ncbi:MAG TPA: ParB/RepB/Spo0J family partition protein [Methylomirabilota bacterium]|nr:ParB/RepB/Spo0J family partition protein [Methylomirabilota bacterium]
MARPDFRAAAARRLSEDRELSPSIISLLSSDNVGRSVGVRVIPVDNIESNPNQPRTLFDADALHELAASVREHGVLQPILVRPLGQNRYHLVAGERRWRAAKEAGLATIPALVEELDDDTALEISIIENLQREDLSPLEEAAMYDRMVREHGYSIRKLAEKLGKDKGYLENRLRLAGAPDEIRELVSLRKDTLSHAYELMKVQDDRKRRRLAARVATGELSLVKLREKIEGRPRRAAVVEPQIIESEIIESESDNGVVLTEPQAADDGPNWTSPRRQATSDSLGDDSLVNARHQLSEAVEELVGVLRAPDVVRSIPDTDRANLAKYLTIAKLKLENAIAMVRSGDMTD